MRCRTTSLFMFSVSFSAVTIVDWFWANWQALQDSAHVFAHLPPSINSNKTTTTTTQDGSSTTTDKLDIFNRFPHEPPPPAVVANHPATTCHVTFRDRQMALCHIIPWGSNFGDELGPAIIKRILEYIYWPCSVDTLPVLDVAQDYDHPNNTCLFSVGSVLFLWRHNDHVWGSGSFQGDARKQCRTRGMASNLTMYATRGPRTAHQVAAHCKIQTPPAATSSLSSYHSNNNNTFGFEPVGDPGFLIPFVFPEYKYDPDVASKEYCLIRHYFDRKNHRQTPEANLLDVQQPWQSMVEKMLQCKFVISSSLHGVILADAFGIPNRWLANRRVESFKFDDYYETFPGRPYNRSDSVQSARDEMSMYPTLSPKEREVYASRILSSFPRNLFTTVTRSRKVPS